MIKIIVTIDSARGLNGGWELPEVDAYHAKKVATGHLEALREPFEHEGDIAAFFNLKPNTWVLGSSKLYEQAIPYANQLLITQVNGIFECDSYFPKFEDKFILVKKSRIRSEHGVDYQHQVWVNKLFAKMQDARDADTRQIDVDPRV